MTPTTLVIGGRAAMREAAIAAAVDPAVPSAAILEGMASGTGDLDARASSALQIIRIAPGCMCCVGNLTLRVTLNRLLRKPPSRLFIAIADSTHLKQIRAFLTQEPYDAFLTLSDHIDVDKTIDA
ncbi:MAG: GTPase [Burkholderiaceae bacterium]|nr:GTPase [Burkholderiaceae bacterium]